jgi:phenylpropionate dioxygenase-like ring-hydroxylating dioxygenase large terminal subunit
MLASGSVVTGRMSNDWHVVARSQNLLEGGILAVDLLDEMLVLWRSGGRAMAWRDRCPHRGARLSLGTVADGTLVCPYHGWRYAPDGRCVSMPAQPEQPPPADVCATTYGVEERDGFIWVRAGDAAARAAELEPGTRPGDDPAAVM